MGLFMSIIACSLCVMTSWLCLGSQSRRVEYCAHEVLGLLHQLVRDAGFDYTKQSLVRLGVLGTVVCMVLGLLVSHIFSIVLPVMAFVAVVVFLAMRKRAKMLETIRIEDEVCFSIARLLRSGQPLVQAIASTSTKYPHAAQLREWTHLTSFGISLEEAIGQSSMDDTTVSADSRVLGASVRYAHSMGGNSARVFERMGEYFHRVYSLNAETKAAIAQVQLSAWVIGLLPVVMLFISALLGSSSASFLLKNPFGWVCLVVGIALEVGGVAWMKKMIDKEVGVWTL